MTIHWFVRVCCVPAMAWMVLLRAAMTVGDYAPERHDRFYVASSEDDPERDFILEPVDFSGVGIVDLGSSIRYATMVSPTFFLSATHWHASSGAVTFFPDNDPEGPSVVRNIAGGTSVAGSDLWLGWLEQPLPTSIAAYPLFPDHGTGFLGSDVWAVGKEDENSPTSQRVGLNIVDGVGTGAELFVYPNDYADDELAVFSYGGNADEFRYQSGDSGGPTFVSMNGIYALFGINYLIYGEGAVFSSVHDPALPGSACTLASAFIDEINGAMLSAFEGSTEQLTLVPEPGTAVMALLVVASFCSRRSSRSRFGEGLTPRLRR